MVQEGLRVELTVGVMGQSSPSGQKVLQSASVVFSVQRPHSHVTRFIPRITNAQKTIDIYIQNKKSCKLPAYLPSQGDGSLFLGSVVV